MARSFACRTLLFVAVVVLVPAASSASPLTTLKEDALFRVIAQKPDRMSRGTAFVDSGGRVITAYHVIDGARRIELVSFDNRVYDDVVIDYIAPSRDIAILEVAGVTADQGYELHLDVAAGRAGDPVALHGAPLGMGGVVLVGKRAVSGLQSGSVWQAPDPETGEETSIFEDPSIRVLSLDITTEGGASGAPIVDGVGRVVAILSGSRNTGRGLAWAIPMDVLDDVSAGWFEISRRASEHAWSGDSVLRPGISFGRSFVSMPLTSPAARCRIAVWEYEKVEHQVKLGALRAKGALELFVETVTLGHTRDIETLSDETIMKTLQMLGTLTSLEGSMDRAARFERARNAFYRTCFDTAVRQAFEGPFAVTRHNALTYRAMEEDLRPYVTQMTDDTLPPAEAALMFRPIVELMERDDLLTGQRIVEMAAAIQEIVEEKAVSLSTPSSEVAAGFAVAEHLAALEETMDPGTVAYSLSAGSYALNLAGGWMPADTELFRALGLGEALPNGMVGLYADAIPARHLGMLWLQQFPPEVHGVIQPAEVGNLEILVEGFAQVLQIETTGRLGAPGLADDPRFLRVVLTGRFRDRPERGVVIHGYAPAAPVPTRGMLFCVEMEGDDRAPCSALEFEVLP